MINFHPFQISVFYSFCYWFSIKFLKLFLVSVFFFGGGGGRLLVACFNWSLLSYFKLFCGFIIITQGCKANLYANDGLLTRIIDWLTALRLNIGIVGKSHGNKKIYTTSIKSFGSIFSLQKYATVQLIN